MSGSTALDPAQLPHLSRAPSASLGGPFGPALVDKPPAYHGASVSNWQPHHVSPLPRDADDWYSLSSIEDHRTAIVRHFGLSSSLLDTASLEGKCRLARAAFGGATILITMRIDEKIVVLAHASNTSDSTDWTHEADMLHPVTKLLHEAKLVRESWLVEGTLVVQHVRWTSSGWHATPSPRSGDFCLAIAPLILPVPSTSTESYLAIGALCVLSHFPRTFTNEERELLLSLSVMVARELQRGENAVRQASDTAQSAFISEFLQLAIATDVKFEPQDVTSPAMNAVREGVTLTTDLQRAFVRRYSHIFDRAVHQLCALTSATAALILDLRAFTQTSLASRAWTEVAAGSGRPLPVKHLQPITLLGSFGFEDLHEKLQGQEALAAIEAALSGWHGNPEGLMFQNSSLNALLPPNSRSSLAVPILDHHSKPALLVLLSLPFSNPADVSVPDNLFIKNVGQLCLTSLIKDSAVQADRSKLAFVSQMSHELVTPTHGLTGQLELMRQLVPDLKELSPLLDLADICLDSLRTILDDSLDFAKLASSTEISAPLETSDVIDLSTLVALTSKAACARKIRLLSESSENDSGDSCDLPIRRRRNVDVIIACPARDMGWAAVVNAGEIRRIVSNIVGNAYAFSDHGFIRVSLEASTGPDATGLTMCKITVADSGIGMSPEFLEQGWLFAPFQQADSFSPGAGLGMSIVQDLVKRMNGHIKVNSTLGEGTTVEVDLPIHLLNTGPAAQAVVQVLSDELGGLKDALRQRFSGRYGFRESTGAELPKLSVSSGSALSPAKTVVPEIAAAISPPSQPAALVKPSPFARPESAFSDSSQPNRLRILVAEDNAIARSILTRFLKVKGYSFHAVNDGHKAVSFFRLSEAREFDVGILDIGMPHKDGLEAAYEMRAHEKSMGWRPQRLIALTALASDEDRRRGLAGLFDLWLTKGGKSLRSLEKELGDLQAAMDAPP